MEFNCDVKIVDAMMGAGKSSAAINCKLMIKTPHGLIAVRGSL